MQKIDFYQLRRGMDALVDAHDNDDDLAPALSELLDQPEEAYDELVEAHDGLTTKCEELQDQLDDTEYVADDILQGCGVILYETDNAIDAEIMEALGELLAKGRYLDVLNQLKAWNTIR